MYWTTGFLGFLLLVAPYILGYSDNTSALWSSFLIGIAVMGISLLEGTVHDKGKWEYWTISFLGAVAIAAPFVFGFGTHQVALWTSLLLGAFTFVIAGRRAYGKKLTSW